MTLPFCFDRHCEERSDVAISPNIFRHCKPVGIPASFAFSLKGENYGQSSTSLQDASDYPWILPRPKKHATGMFFAPPQVGPASSNPIIHPMQKPSAKAEGLHGVDNGIRTHDLQSHNLTR